MHYFLIGFVLLIVIRLYMNLKYSFNILHTTLLHEIGTVTMGLYLISVFAYVSDNVTEGIMNGFVCYTLFIPLGFFLPLLFVRYRSLPITLFVSAVVSLCVVLLQFIKLDSIEFINVVLGVLGAVTGYVVFAVNREVFQTVKRGFIVKKRKKIKVDTFIHFEADFIIFMILLMFIVGNSTYRFLDSKPKESKDEEVVETMQYSDIYYADEANYERYEAYAKLHPEMDIDEVIWRVEANLDKDFYTDVYTYPENEKEPFLLNKYNRVSDDFEPEELVTVYGEFQATPDTKAAFDKMKEDMEAIGLQLHIVSSYRSVSYQKGLFNTFAKRDGEEAADKYSARGGFSEHCTGRALDVSDNPSDLDVFAESESGKWVYENAYKYGFILRYPEGSEDITGYMYESWHISYVGTDISKDMKKKKIDTLEEYVVKYIDNEENTKK
ncbi:MAG: D-alanyl-D-alanine carboxypeptidase family protein [Lachnospiraceae bacterium]|nr:D-alanyl-D-alanine carboxypeptidase family protein [Lachnospiraceae bacterium]